MPLMHADPTTFLDGYKTTVVSSLVLAQASSRKRTPITFLNLTTAGILFPPYPGMGAYISSNMAAVKLLQAFAAENSHIVSLPAEFLGWIASPEAKFLNGKLVFASWDVKKLKSREKVILGGPRNWRALAGIPRIPVLHLGPVSRPSKNR
ncbi:hypothetical protein PG987_005793 [Apiospora arundinis]